MAADKTHPTFRMVRVRGDSFRVQSGDMSRDDADFVLQTVNEAFEAPEPALPKQDPTVPYEMYEVRAGVHDSWTIWSNGMSGTDEWVLKSPALAGLDEAKEIQNALEELTRKGILQQLVKWVSEGHLSKMRITILTDTEAGAIVPEYAVDPGDRDRTREKGFLGIDNTVLGTEGMFFIGKSRAIEWWLEDTKNRKLYSGVWSNQRELEPYFDGSAITLRVKENDV